MNNYLAIYSQPWPVIDGKPQLKVVVQAPTLKRALEVAEEKGEIYSIGVNDQVPILVDCRVGATSVNGGLERS